MDGIQRAAVDLTRSPISVGVSLGIGDLDWTAAEREATRMAPRTHRAAADAAYWATLWWCGMDIAPSRMPDQSWAVPG